MNALLKIPSGILRPSLRCGSIIQQQQSIHIEKRIEELGHELPPLSDPKGNYRSVIQSNSLLFLAGHLPQKPNGDLIRGKIGVDRTPEEGYEAARLASLSLIQTLKNNLGDLDRVAKIVKVVGFVNCVDGFDGQPAVINGCSDTLGEVFGDKVGTHARSAVGTNALPLNVTVEIEAIVEIKQ